MTLPRLRSILTLGSQWAGGVRAMSAQAVPAFDHLGHVSDASLDWAALRPLGRHWRHRGRRTTPNRADGFQACLIDAAGTLLVPSESTADVYHRYASKYQEHPISKLEMLDRFRRAYNRPWGQSSIRYVGDGKPFWKYIVQQSTGCTEPEMFEELYDYYAQPEAWRVAPGAREALSRIQQAGVSLAVVSNFDTRLRPLLHGLKLDQLFDVIVVSAEVGHEKPNRCIFEAALDALGTAPHDAVHIGDDRRNDLWGARDAGVHAWLWGTDVTSFDQLAYRVINGSKFTQWDDDEDVLGPTPSETSGVAVLPDT